MILFVPEFFCKISRFDNFRLFVLPDLKSTILKSRHHTIRELRNDILNSSLVTDMIDGIMSKSVGHDGLSILMIRMCCPYILPFFTHILNCIIEHRFSDRWKHASIIPLSKINNSKELKDLKPISVLSEISKILHPN